jgi:hypothetical protein
VLPRKQGGVTHVGEHLYSSRRCGCTAIISVAQLLLLSCPQLLLLLLLPRCRPHTGERQSAPRAGHTSAPGTAVATKSVGHGVASAPLTRHSAAIRTLAGWLAGAPVAAAPRRIDYQFLEHCAGRMIEFTIA